MLHPPLPLLPSLRHAEQDTLRGDELVRHFSTVRADCRRVFGRWCGGGIVFRLNESYRQPRGLSGQAHLWR